MLFFSETFYNYQMLGLRITDTSASAETTSARIWEAPGGIRRH